MQGPDPPPAAQPRETDAAAAPAEFDALVDRHQAPLLRYVARTLGCAAADDHAQDVVQETFIRLHRQIQRHGLASLGDVRLWLYRVAHNLAIDAGRRLTRRRRLHQQITRDALHRPPSTRSESDPLAAITQHEAATLALAELQNLPDPQRQAILLRVFEGLTMQQIADVTDTTASNVCHRLTQGLAALARALRRKGAV